MKSTQPENSGFFETLLDSAVDAIIIIDQEGTVQRFNSSAQLMFGYSAAEVVQKNIRMLMPEPARSRHDGYLARYSETGKAAIIGKGRDEHGLRKSGEIFPMRLSVGESRPMQTQRCTWLKKRRLPSTRPCATSVAASASNPDELPQW